MKPLFIVLMIATSSINIQSQTCVGAIGDVKLSILDYPDFIEENGECWVPLDGRKLDLDSELTKKG